MTDTEARLRDANGLVAEIAACGRRFFAAQTPERQNGHVEVVEGRALWRDEYTGKLLQVAGHRECPGFSHGSTLRAFVGNLLSWVENGEPSCSEAFGPHWAYPREDCQHLREAACEMRFLPWDAELDACAAIQRGDTPERPPLSTLRLGRNQGHWTVVMEWPTSHGDERHCVVAGPRRYKQDALAALARLSQVPEAVIEHAAEAHSLAMM